MSKGGYLFGPPVSASWLRPRSEDSCCRTAYSDLKGKLWGRMNIVNRIRLSWEKLEEMLKGLWGDSERKQPLWLDLHQDQFRQRQWREPIGGKWTQQLSHPAGSSVEWILTLIASCSLSHLRFYCWRVVYYVEMPSVHSCSLSHAGDLRGKNNLLTPPGR